VVPPPLPPDDGGGVGFGFAPESQAAVQIVRRNAAQIPAREGMRLVGGGRDGLRRKTTTKGEVRRIARASC
jgi:hypothetical protein